MIAKWKEHIVSTPEVLRGKPRIIDQPSAFYHLQPETDHGRLHSSAENTGFFDNSIG